MSQNSAQLLAEISRLRDASFSSNEERSQVRLAVWKLLTELESPWETVHRLAWMEPAFVAALKICLDVDLFRKWTEDGGGPKSVAELARISEMDEELLSRVARHLAAMFALRETAEDTYALTPFTESLAKPGASDTIPFMMASTWPAFLNLPQYLADNAYQNPSDPKRSNWQALKQSDESYFEFISSDPQRVRTFQNVMLAYNDARGNWVDLYPTDSLVADWKSDRPLLVDAGGGKGLDIERFRERHPNLPPGSLVLQELEAAVPTILVHESIKVMAHNLFEEQPVKGARAYYAHIVFHGWTDQEAVQVLKMLAASMEKGYSKLLLHEKVIPTQGATPDITAGDLTMLATFSARERTFRMWEDLLVLAGFKFLKLWSSPAFPESIIEAELA